VSAPAPRVVDERPDTVWWYAVVDAPAAPEALTQLGDPTLHAVTVGPLALIVSAGETAVTGDSGFAMPAGVGVDEDLARAAVHHDEVVSGLAAVVPALLPIRFGTLADHQGLSTLATATVEHCVTLLDRVRGCQEWGLRLMRTGQDPAAEDADASSGAAYLAAISDRHRARREAATVRDDLVAELQTRLAPLATQVAGLSTRRPGQLANLAYLVRRERAPQFHETVRAAQDELRRCGVDAVVTGPWAPYSFTDLGAVA